MTPFFYILIIKSLPAHLQSSCGTVCFIGCNINHQAFAAVTAPCTVYLRFSFFVELMHSFIKFCIIQLLEPFCKFYVFSFFFGSQLLNGFDGSLYMQYLNLYKDKVLPHNRLQQTAIVLFYIHHFNFKYQNTVGRNFRRSCSYAICKSGWNNDFYFASCF
jgi:hypothetical protein